MIYECAYCNKLFDEGEGIMCLAETPSFVGMKPIYVFKYKNCMFERGRREFDKFKKREGEL